MQQVLPIYEVRVFNGGANKTEYSLWQIPSEATPQVIEPIRIAYIRGRSLRLIEHKLIRKLDAVHIKLIPEVGETLSSTVDEELCLHLGLLFKTISPLRKPERIAEIIDGLEDMQKEELAYWAGMAMHRSNPRRVLSALRTLLTSAPQKKRS